MTIDLNKEAEEYAELQFEYMIMDEASKFDCINDFIAGANSKYIQAKILQAQIDVIDSLFNLGLKDVYQTMNTPVEIYNGVINPLKNKLNKQLKELENG